MPFNDEQKWALLVDRHSTKGGYIPLVSTDLNDTRTFQVLPPEAYDFGTRKRRHGSILSITASELVALRAKWPGR